MNQDQLTRSQSDRMVAGVCGGLSTYLGIDSTLVRLAFVLLSLASGIGLAIYLILWVVMPKGPSPEEEMIKIGADVTDPSVYKTENTGRKPGATVGIMFVLLGVFFLFSELGWFGSGFWMLLLIGAGGYALWRWWKANQETV